MTTLERIGLGMMIVGAILMLLTIVTKAEQRTIYGADGRVLAREATDSQGSKTLYDANGRVVGRSSTDSQGTTAVYDASGNRIGTVSGGKKR